MCLERMPEVVDPTLEDGVSSVCLYNEWLPAPVKEKLPEEKHRFHEVVLKLADVWEPGNSAAVKTTNFVHLIESYLRTRSELAVADVQRVVDFGIELILKDKINIYVQARWANLLTKIFKRYRKQLNLTLDWRPLYNILRDTHFKRQQFYRGLATNSDHASAFIQFIKRYRYFFSSTSATEIWNEFRHCFGNTCHTSSLKAVGFLSLFLPTNACHTLSDSYVFTAEWVTECFQLWQTIPSCYFWNSHWLVVIGRCIKHRALNWEPYLPMLFSSFLNSFYVPIGKTSEYPPVNWTLYNVRSEFLRSTPKIVGKAIVNLLASERVAQSHFETLVNFLEPYYHPFNGGSWTISLQLFLSALVQSFFKRLESECGVLKDTGVLGPPERSAFVKQVLRLAERGQYSKDDLLAKTCSTAFSQLSYVEPSLALPVVISSFETAMDSVTATHQLSFALETLALSVRSILLSYQREASEGLISGSYALSCRNALVKAMFSTLAGLDANDPSKTLATMQLYTAVLASVSVSEISAGVESAIFPIDWDRWSFAFLDQLFFLLQSLEPGSQSCLTTDTTTSDGFLVDAGSSYSSLLRLVFCKLPVKLSEKAIGRVKKFVTGSVLPGAVHEIADLCYEAMQEDPSTSMRLLLQPIMTTLISTMSDTPNTGFGSDVANPKFNPKETLSHVQEITAIYQLRILAAALPAGGATLIEYKKQIKDVLAIAFNAPSCKVNDVGKSLLKHLLCCLVSYEPIRNFRLSNSEGVENWISSKENLQIYEPRWHLSSQEEIMFVEELVELHLLRPLSVLQKITSENHSLISPGQEKEFLRVLLSRIEAVLGGLGSCIPDFRVPERSITVTGSFGASLRFTELRNDVAKILHESCGYLLKNKGDESSIFKLLLSVIDTIVNFGSIENDFWTYNKRFWEAQKLQLTEPAVNFLTTTRPVSSRRPLWMVYDRVLLQNFLRSSETQFYEYYVISTGALPSAIEFLGDDLLNICLHQYKEIRAHAGDVFTLLLMRYPRLRRKFLPMLTRTLINPKASEESALGACSLLRTGTFIRYLLEDWFCLSTFFDSVLRSSHHDSTKAQNAINKVFLYFNWYYGGVSMGFQLDDISYFESTVSQIESSAANGSSVHWRYNLFAQGFLLFLSLTPFCQSSKQSLDLVRAACGQYLKNLSSELPALRLLSVRAILLLLGAESDITVDDVLNGATKFGESLLNEQFGETVVNVLALDHHYSEDDGVDIPRTITDIGLVSLIPTYMDDWPLTRTWDSKTIGVGFSKASAKLFEQLTLKYGQTLLDIVRRPLETAAFSVNERGKQCTAAEIMGGVLRSNAACVISGWDAWLHSLLAKALKRSTLESASEWVACIRFAMGAEKQISQGPSLRHKLLECLAKLLPASPSSTLVAKRLNLLAAAIIELHPKSLSEYEILYLVELLDEGLGYLSHSAPQVRKATGSILCIVSASLRMRFEESEADLSRKIEQAIARCMNLCIYQASLEAKKLQSLDEKTSVTNRDKTSVRAMETIFHFMITCLKSGRFPVLADMTIELIHPLLLLQDTSEKDLASLARSALHCLKWQVFPPTNLFKAVHAILGTISEENWRVRVAALSFLQPFVYRHSFMLEADVWLSIWNMVIQSLSDSQLEVREMSASTAAGMLKVAESSITIQEFRKQALARALSLHTSGKSRFTNGAGIVEVHAAVLALAACVLSVPYDVPSWLPEMLTALTHFNDFPWPIRATVAKTVGQFRRTHSDAWEIHRHQFSEQQLELLLNSGTASYFA